VLPRATFRAYGSRTEYLACTVAHEISHYLRQHIFKQSYYKHHNLSESDDKKAETELRRWGREQELEADRDAADMLARAGYPARVCQHEIDFMHRSVGDGSKTEETSTHPGYEERLAAIRSHYDELEKKTIKPQMGAAAVFEYDPVDNYLTVSSLDK
jgi:predicted Zn-dependent protease